MSKQALRRGPCGIFGSTFATVHSVTSSRPLTFTVCSVGPLIRRPPMRSRGSQQTSAVLSAAYADFRCHDILCVRTLSSQHASLMFVCDTITALADFVQKGHTVLTQSF